MSGSFYTENVWEFLDSQENISADAIESYDLGILEDYDAVIHYGNTFTDIFILTEYVNQGGGLISTPWLALFTFDFDALPFHFV